MNADEFEKIYQAKGERRKQLAALPFEEKILIVERLQELGFAMREARKSLVRSEERVEPDLKKTH